MTTTSPVVPPHEAYAPGWELYEYAIGYYASVSLSDAETMTITFAPGEMGRDSGLWAKDARIIRLRYGIYVPAPQTQFVRIPGGIVLPEWARSPGWNTVDCSLTSITINGRVVKDFQGAPVVPDPTDLSCYVVSGHMPYVKLDTFNIATIYDQKFQTRITHARDNDPDLNGQLTIDAIDNSTLRFKYRGTDGVVRSATLDLV